MKEKKSFLEKNLLLIVGFLVLALMISYFATSKSAPVPALSLSDASAASQPVYRFWSDPYRSHFYTVSPFERDFVINNDKNWIFEGVVFDAFAKQQPNSNPVYRFWNNEKRSHFYTQSTLERDKVRTDSQWRYEGVAYYTLGKTPGSKPVYRLYSPVRNSHYYVQNEAEKNALLAQGEWNFEGIAFYSKKASASPVIPVEPVKPPIPINGSCGSANGSAVDTVPNSQLCDRGSASRVSGSGPWSWSCRGSNGGSTSQCSAQKITVAQTQCSDGIDNDGDGVTDLVDTDCMDANDNTESGTSPSNGQCGIANQTTASSIPAAQNLCARGAIQNQSTSGDQLTWTCQGENGGTSDSCQMTLTTVIPINGQCGSSDGQTVAIAPSTNLCNAGSPTAVDGSGPWTWSCNGSDGGTNSSCIAQKTVVTSSNCGIDHGQILTGPPQNDLCANGLIPADQTGDGPWLWTCRNNNGEFITSCRAELDGDTGETQGVCGSAINSCDVGDFIDTDDSDTQHLWGCIGSGGFETFADCSREK